jgi:SAM-dependent methyltransferase
VPHPRRLNLGCGLTAPTGWINLDGSWNARLAFLPWLRLALGRCGVIPSFSASTAWSRRVRWHDLRRPLPFGAASISAVYASHVLANLYLEEATRLLDECWRVLEPGGVVRIVDADLEAIVGEYMGSCPFGEPSGELAGLTRADRLNKRMLLRSENRPNWRSPYGLYELMQDFHSHKWLYDADSLIFHLQRAGFREPTRKGFRDSAIPGIEEVELAGRVLSGEGVCVEASKPA